MNKLIKKLPETTSLYYCDYTDNLDDKYHDSIIKDCIDSNCLNPLYEKSFEWNLFEMEDQSIDYIIDETYTEEEKELIREDEDLELEIIETIRERDDSDYIADLIKNTGDRHYFYSLGVNISQQGISGADIKEIKKAVKRFNIVVADEDIRELSDNAFYGGNLGILFDASSDAFIGVPEKTKSIIIDKDARLAVIDYGNGSGHDVPLARPVVLPYKTEAIGIDRYYTEDVCGMTLPSVDISFSSEPVKSRLKIKQDGYNASSVGNIIADDITMLHVRGWNETINPVGEKCELGHLYKYDIENWREAPSNIKEALKEDGGWIAKIKKITPSANYIIGYVAFDQKGKKVLAQKCLSNYEAFNKAINNIIKK